ncbi:MAG: gliding motility-associated ABC transporter substrate-binding protein GldG [Cyclobacteriaceae bacterium]|nr:gliding motility-associated ABC transporter substrate-binding protein GldG [Cyclobacteriaceae bacterium]
MVTRNQRKITDLLLFAIGIMACVLANQFSGHFPQRWDLTEEKRYSIQPATKELLRNLQETVYLEVYLEGEMPAGFLRLQKSIKETLEEFRVHAGDRLQFQFIDPDQAASAQARQEFYNDLIQKGIQASNVIDTKDGQKTEKVIFPGAVVAQGNRELGVLLLKGNKGAGPDEQLNQSIEGLEYELASAIRALATVDRPRIALIKGHGELENPEIVDLTNSLLDRYQVHNVNLTQGSNLMGYDAALVVKPIQIISEEDKYKLDQFVMNGGKILFFLDALQVEMDSITGAGTYAFPYETNLDDLLFKYGVRINKDLLVDRLSQRYPIITGNVGNQPNINWLNWPFYPLINYSGDHPIVKNLDALSGKFVSSMDTVKAEGITKTPLLFSSQYSRKVDYPVRVSLNELRKEFNPETFNQGPIPLAYLLEGSFTSLYKNRLLPEGVVDNSFKADGEPSKIVVVADGDMLRNDINPKTQQPLPMGFDLATGQEAFANRDFIMNAVSYLLNDQGIINARTKEIKIRPLDTVRIGEERVKWQLINLIVPLILLVIYALARQFWRKRKFASF